MVKRKLEQAVAGHNGSARSAQRLLNTLNDDDHSRRQGDSAWRNAATRELQKIQRMCQTTLKMDTTSGEQLDVHVVKLPEVLSWFCATNKDFARLATSSIKGKVAAGVYL